MPYRTRHSALGMPATSPFIYSAFLDYGLTTLSASELSKQDEVECPICYLPWEYECQEDNVRTKHCNHSFHKSCLSTWIKEHPTCPMCRENLLTPETLEIPEVTMDYTRADYGVDGEASDDEGYEGILRTVEGSSMVLERRTDSFDIRRQEDEEARRIEERIRNAREVVTRSFDAPLERLNHHQEEVDVVERDIERRRGTSRLEGADSRRPLFPEAYQEGDQRRLRERQNGPRVAQLQGFGRRGELYLLERAWQDAQLRVLHIRRRLSEHRMNIVSRGASEDG